MKISLFILALAALGAGTALAHHEAGGQPATQAQPPTASRITGKGTGVIQHIDQEKRTVTIKHGPLQGIKVPGMTMSYVVKDKAMLSNLQPQQNVEFELTYENRRYFITSIK